MDRKNRVVYVSREPEGGWSRPQRLTRKLSPQNFTAVDLDVADSGGAAAIAWLGGDSIDQRTGFLGRKLQVSQRPSAAAPFGPPRTVSKGRLTAFDPDLELRDDGAAVVLVAGDCPPPPARWYRGEIFTVKGGQPPRSRTVRNSKCPTEGVGLALGPGRQTDAMFSGIIFESRVKLAPWTGSGIGPARSIGTPGVYATGGSLGSDAAGNVLTTWKEGPDGLRPGDVEVWLARRGADGSQVRQKLVTGAGIGPELEVGSGGEAIALWQEPTGAHRLLAATYSESLGIEPPVAASPGLPYSAAARFDAAVSDGGRGFVAWSAPPPGPSFSQMLGLRIAAGSIG